jgi:hypothetical protein
MSSFGYPYLMPMDGQNPSSSSTAFTKPFADHKNDDNDDDVIQEQSITSDDTHIIETEHNPLYQAVKRFQESSAVQSHPEILSGRGVYNHEDNDDDNETIQKTKTRVLLKKRQSMKKMKNDATNTNAEIMDYHRVPLIPHRARRQRSGSFHQKIDTYMTGEQRIIQNLANSPLSTDTDGDDDDDDDDGGYGDDILKRLVYQQCNIIAYWVSQGKILDYCGKTHDRNQLYI